MSKDRNTRSPSKPAYDNPVGNKGDLYDEAKGHPHGGRHAGRQRTEGEHEQRPKPASPVGHASDEKLGRKPPSEKPPP